MKPIETTTKTQANVYAGKIYTFIVDDLPLSKWNERLLEFEVYASFEL